MKPKSTNPTNLKDRARARAKRDNISYQAALHIERATTKRETRTAEAALPPPPSREHADDIVRVSQAEHDEIEANAAVETAEIEKVLDVDIETVRTRKVFDLLHELGDNPVVKQLAIFNGPMAATLDNPMTRALGSMSALLDNPMTRHLERMNAIFNNPVFKAAEHMQRLTEIGDPLARFRRR